MHFAKIFLITARLLTNRKRYPPIAIQMTIRVTSSACKQTCQIKSGTTLLKNLKQSQKPHLGGAFASLGCTDYLPFVAYVISVMPVSVPLLKVPALTRLPWPW
jgi:hypothetical protein